MAVESEEFTELGDEFALILFPVDLIGTTDEILQRLAIDPVVARVTELRVEVPYEFEKHEYEQILHDVRYNLAPQLGWTPASAGAGT